MEVAATGGCVLLALVTLLTAVMSTTTVMPPTMVLVTPLGFLFVSESLIKIKFNKEEKYE